MSEKGRENQKLELKASSSSPPFRASSGERELVGEATISAMEERLTADKSKWHSHLKGFSAVMRRNPTEAENVLWQALRNRQLDGIKFRRQHAIGRYIVDFISSDHKLIVEVDGAIHTEESQVEYDGGRSFDLQANGYQVLRFTNQQVVNCLPEVIAEIQQSITPLK